MRFPALPGILAVLAGCTLAGSPGPQGPNPTPSSSTEADKSSSPSELPEEAHSGTSTTDIGSAVVTTAFEAIGTPYLWGGTGANGFDCSGLIQYAYGEYGINLPRVSRDQLRRGQAVEVRMETLQPGDILGFSAVAGGEATHVGLYVGDGRFIHSSSNGVRVSGLREPFWQQHFMAARRIVR